MNQAERDIRRKKSALEYAATHGNVAKTCRHFGISRETFYQWRRAYNASGERALVNKKPGYQPGTCPRRTPAELEEKILYLRQKYHFGPLRISWYLFRYHGRRITGGGVYQVLRRHEMNRLPRNQRRRSIPSCRYEKQIPGHHVQVDVKFLSFAAPSGKTIKRYQYTAIDDATRIRALKIYPRHTQKNAIAFIDYVIQKFPFRIHTVRTDNGHEFQSQFHWHIEDLGIRHAYIKPRTPRLNGKVERSHGSDEREFYQLLDYKGDVDLKAKLTEWENFYNFHRPHGAHNGKTPYEILKERLVC